MRPRRASAIIGLIARRVHRHGPRPRPRPRRRAAPTRRRPPRGLPAGLAAAVALLAVACVLTRSTDGAGGPSFNQALHSSRIDACVRPRNPRATAAYAYDGSLLPFTVATGHEPGTRPACRPDELRVLRLQVLTIDGQPAYVRRGGCRQPCLVRQPTVHVLARDLTRPLALLPPAVRGGDGAPAAGCSSHVADAPARVGGELGRMYYKTPRELHATHQRTGAIGAGARWSNYGDPGRRYRSAGRASADYSYLLWNLPRRQSGGLLPGGGIVEALIEQGQTIDLCRVPALTLASFDAVGAPNGLVVFGYARVAAPAAAPAGAPIYGWLLLGYRYRGRPFRPTTSPPSSTAGP